MEVKIMKAHKYFFMAIAFGLVLTVSLNSDPLWASDKKEIEQKKSDIRKMAKETLSRLYKIQPSAKKAISKSAGYAVFSNFGMKIFFAGGGSGKGIVFDKKTKKQTFMKMVEIQAGLGLGAKKFRLQPYEDLGNATKCLSNTEREAYLKIIGASHIDDLLGWREENSNNHEYDNKMRKQKKKKSNKLR